MIWVWDIQEPVMQMLHLKLCGNYSRKGWTQRKGDALEEEIPHTEQNQEHLRGDAKKNALLKDSG